MGELVEGALLHFQGQRYALHAWVVMPDHVHAVLTCYPEHPLQSVLHSWKSFTSHAINRMLGRSGPFWQKESFDHLIRSEEHARRFLEYVETNPVVAGLCGRPEEWPFSSARWHHHGTVSS